VPHPRRLLNGRSADYKRVPATAKYVIHTVGPVWSGGRRREPELLRSCYVNSLKLAAEHGVHSIAFPSISTGAYRFPIEQAARLAVKMVREELVRPTSVKLVRLVCFSAADLEIYEKVWNEPHFLGSPVNRVSAVFASKMRPLRELVQGRVTGDQRGWRREVARRVIPRCWRWGGP
jgi:hypothetical protein